MCRCGCRSSRRWCWSGRWNEQCLAKNFYLGGCSTTTASSRSLIPTSWLYIHGFCVCKPARIHCGYIHCSCTNRVHVHSGNNAKRAAILDCHHFGYICSVWASSSPDRRRGGVHCSDIKQCQRNGYKLCIEHVIDGALVFAVAQHGTDGGKLAAGIKHWHCAGAGSDNHNDRSDISASASNSTKPATANASNPSTVNSPSTEPVAA